ncbi:MAG: 2-oxo acid dehydrogenase subunit E2 [Spirochaetaceae bacterium]|nr:2-oxo acid dehydrogenase subunit E2 [Spirochaetaceae bacterium]
MRSARTTRLRKLSMLGFDLVENGHNFVAILEFDITSLRKTLRERRVAGCGGSLFSFLLKAIATCLAEMPDFNSIIDYRNTTAFGEVDLNIPIEVERGGRLVTKQYIVRGADRKSAAEIASEIHAAKTGDDDESGYVFSSFLQALLTAIPRRASVFLMRSLLRNHAKVKELSGTVFVTSVSMFSNVPGYVIPYIGGPKAVSFALGSAVKKPVVRRDAVEIREMLNMTVVFNHDIVDGAPAARFINRLRKIVELEYAKLL